MSAKKDFDIDPKLRIRTLHQVLLGKSIEELSCIFCLTKKGMKYRLTQLYKYYKVKNRYELMAKFVNMPVEVNQLITEDNIKAHKEYIQNNIKETGIFLPNGGN
jgi:hypothetical protein